MKALSWFFALLATAAFFVPHAGADERKVVTSIALEQEYTDNVFFSHESSVNDFITTVSPALELENNTERLKAGVKIKIHGILYLDNSELNTLDQDYSAALRYALSSRANLFGSAGYRRDSTIDSDFTETGLLQGSNVTRNRYNFKAGGGYALSEITGLQLQYGYDSDRYDDEDHSDNSVHNGSLLLSRDMSRLLPETVGRINLGLARYEFEDSRVYSYTGTVGAERGFDERFSYFADLGVSCINSSVDYPERSYSIEALRASGEEHLLVTETDDQVCRMSGQAGVSFKGELTSAKVSLSRNVVSASGDNGVVERTGVSGDLRYRLNENSQFSVAAGYFQNKGSDSTEGVAPIDQRSFWLRPRLRYSLTDNLAAELLYSYSQNEDMKEETDKYKNVVMLRLVYTYTLL